MRPDTRTAPSRAAFDAFFSRWYPRVYGFAARRLASRELAEGATRATLARALELGLLDTGDERAAVLLALAKEEIAHARHDAEA
jgi:DNA-directed RNA polymerase specialized sigma24 family protein